MIFNADHKNDIQLRHYITPITIIITAHTVVMVVMMLGETMTTNKTDLHCCAIIMTSFFLSERLLAVACKFLNNKATNEYNNYFTNCPKQHNIVSVGG